MRAEMTDLNNILEDLGSRIIVTEDKVSELQNNMQKTRQQKMSNRLKINEQQILERWYDFKRSNIRVINILEGQKGNPDKEARVKDIIAEKFLELLEISQAHGKI